MARKANRCGWTSDKCELAAENWESLQMMEFSKPHAEGVSRYTHADLKLRLLQGPAVEVSSDEGET